MDSSSYARYQIIIMSSDICVGREIDWTNHISCLTFVWSTTLRMLE